MSGVVLGGAALAFLAAIVSEPDRRRAALAVGLLSLVVAAGALWIVGPQPMLEARDAAGRPVATVLVLTGEAEREVRRWALEREAPRLPWVLWALLAAGVAGLAARRAALVGVTAAVASAGLVLLVQAGGSAEGEAGVRAAIDALGLRNVDSFTVPPEPWRFASPWVVALGVVSAGALASLALAGRGPPVAARLVPVGAAVAAAGVAAQLVFVGGLPARPLEVATWAAALLAVGAALDRGAPRALLGGGALGLSALAMALP